MYLKSDAQAKYIIQLILFPEALLIDISPKCGTKKVVFYVYFRMAVPISLSLHTVNKSSKNILRGPTDALKNVSPFSMPSFITM